MKIRRWTREDLTALVEVHRAAYGDFPAETHYDEALYAMQLEAFPEGQFLAEVDGRVVGYATSLIVQLEASTQSYDYAQITGGATFSTHDPMGDTLYGADIAVLPEYRGRGVSRRLYEHRRRLFKRYNLRRMFAFGRIPGYRDVAGRMTAQAYVDQVVAGTRKDPALSAHLKAGYRVSAVRLDYMNDPSSVNYSTLIEMDNPDFDRAKRRIATAHIARPVQRARVCAAQYCFRPIAGWRDIELTAEFFAETANEYHCHFLLLPELFTANMLATYGRECDPAEAMQRLAALEGEYRALFTRLASTKQLYIIAGSTPVKRDDGQLYNVAHMFTPAGQVHTQDKLHITPAERNAWNIQPGDGIRLFETPFGKTGIQICYDIEFPEVSRALTFAGAEVIFVPFSTDDQKAYDRVRYCAQARCVENMVYTVLSGNTGNLPTASYAINYAQSCILTPSDFGFPPHAVAAEADANIETVAIADLDFSSLSQARDMGSVRPLYDRRPDLYDLSMKHAVERVRVE